MANTRRNKGHPQRPKSWRKTVLPWTAGIASAALATIIGTVALRTFGLDDNTSNAANNPTKSIIGTTSAISAGNTTASATPLTADDALKAASIKLSRNIGDEDWWAAADPIDVSPKQSAKLYQMKMSDPDDFSNWMRERSVDGEYLDTEVTLTGKHPDGVRLMEMRPKIIKCSRPLTGTLFYAPNAGDSSVVGLGVDLDDPYPKGRVIKTDGTLGAEYFKVKKYDLKLNEKVTFNIHTTTKEHYCEYKLQFEFLAGNQQLTKVIDNHGEPFRVTGLRLDSSGSVNANGAYDVAYNGGVGILGPNHEIAWERADSP